MSVAIYILVFQISINITWVIKKPCHLQAFSEIVDIVSKLAEVTSVWENISVLCLQF